MKTVGASAAAPQYHVVVCPAPGKRRISLTSLDEGQGERSQVQQAESRVQEPGILSANCATEGVPKRWAKDYQAPRARVHRTQCLSLCCVVVNIQQLRHKTMAESFRLRSAHTASKDHQSVLLAYSEAVTAIEIILSGLSVRVKQSAVGHSEA